MNNNQQEAINQARQDQLERGNRYEVLTNQDGWKDVLEYVSMQVKAYANKSITEGFKNMEEYNLERGMVLGLQRLLGNVEYSIKEVRDERDRQSKQPTK